MRTKAKRDANERAIIEALRDHGIYAYQTSDRGLPDLVTWSEGAYKFLEVKSARGRLTRAQQAYKGPRIIVRTPDEALAAWGITR